MQFAAHCAGLVWITAIGLIPLQSLAQTSPRDAARADPLNPAAAVPPLVYKSVFQSYRPNTEASLNSWRNANDTVLQIGGWRAYTKEAQQPEAAAAAEPPASSVTKERPTAKPGHHRHH